jgi:hypothetical protein
MNQQKTQKHKKLIKEINGKFNNTGSADDVARIGRRGMHIGY